MTGFREFQLRMEGYTQKQQAEWERARWQVFHTFAPFMKRKPATPEAWMRFPWEKPKQRKVVRIDTDKENLLNNLYVDFMSRKNKIKS